ncbi:MAG TPA: pirin family protein [Aquiluna sp.]
MLIESRPIKLTTRTGIEVNRTIPHRALKTIGAWCFIDHFGPTKQTDGMVVAAHPHTGLQTVTWLFEGEIEHRDSIGSIQLIRPGQLNLMTAGQGISHSELSLATTENLHAVQMWIALPKESIDVAPAFEHQENLPEVSGDEFTARVLIGEFMGVQSPTTKFSDLVGVELSLKPGDHRFELNPDYEYGLMLAEGELLVEGVALPISSLKYVPTGNTEAAISVNEPSKLMLVGGVPFPEKILMWWNFIGREHEDIVTAREEWNARNDRFGEFEDRIGGWIPAPDLPSVSLQAR